MIAIPMKNKENTQDQLTPVNESLLAFKPNENYRKKTLIHSIRGLRPGDSQAFSTAILAGEYTIKNGGLSIDMSKQIDSRYLILVVVVN